MWAKLRNRVKPNVFVKHEENVQKVVLMKHFPFESTFYDIATPICSFKSCSYGTLTQIQVVTDLRASILFLYEHGIFIFNFYVIFKAILSTVSCFNPTNQTVLNCLSVAMICLMGHCILHEFLLVKAYYPDHLLYLYCISVTVDTVENTPLQLLVLQTDQLSISSL